jgi:hypothetical protein
MPVRPYPIGGKLMSKLSDAVTRQLSAGESVRHIFEGQTGGLNESSRQAVSGLVAVTNQAVFVVSLKAGLRSGVEINRFLPNELIRVVEGDKALPGLAGALRKKNASHPLYRAFGGTELLPALIISTRSGDYTLFFRGKSRGDLRTALLAIQDLTISRS